MSFILDALKKSENDRQRQSGPALFEVRVAQPRSRFPAWAIALVALLVVNLVIIVWLTLRRPATAATAAAQPVAQDGGTATPPRVTPPAQPAPALVPTPAPQTAVAMNAPPQMPPTSPMVTPQQQVIGSLGTSMPAGSPQAEHTMMSDEPIADVAGVNPDDYAPAREPQPPSFGHVQRGLPNGLMTYEQAAAKTSIPPLRMDLHVYAPDPSKRFVMVNMRKLAEGDSLPEGVKVESITADGAVLSYRGTEFMLVRP